MSESPVVEGVFVERVGSLPIVSSQTVTYPNATFRTDNNNELSLHVVGKAVSDQVKDLIHRQARCRVRIHFDMGGSNAHHQYH